MKNRWGPDWEGTAPWCAGDVRMERACPKLFVGFDGIGLGETHLAPGETEVEAMQIWTNYI